MIKAIPYNSTFIGVFQISVRAQNDPNFRMYVKGGISGLLSELGVILFSIIYCQDTQIKPVSPASATNTQ